MTTMTDLHRLRPCRLCDVRMAVPGTSMCTTCDAVVVPQVAARLLEGIKL